MDVMDAINLLKKYNIYDDAKYGRNKSSEKI